MHTQTKPTPETLAALAVEIHANAVKKGFWDGEPDIEKFLMLIVCELAEAVEADRAGKRAQTELYNLNVTSYVPGGLYHQELFEDWIKDTVEDELADAATRILDMAEHFKIANHVTWDRISTEFEEGQSFAGKVYTLVKDMPDWSAHLGANFSFRTALASVLNGIFALADSLKIDLLWHVREKMAYNATREKLHGKKY